MESKSPEEIRAWISDYYGTVLKASTDLKTNACCASGKPPKWIQDALGNVNSECILKFYGCGFPFPDCLEGCTVVDLVIRNSKASRPLFELINE